MLMVSQYSSSSLLFVFQFRPDLQRHPINPPETPKRVNYIAVVSSFKWIVVSTPPYRFNKLGRFVESPESNGKNSYDEKFPNLWLRS